MNSTLQSESEFERSILFFHCLHQNMYPMVKIPSSFLLYVCQTIQSSIVPCPIPWPGGCNDRVVMTMVEGDTRVTVRMTSGWWHSVQWPCRHPGLTNQFRQVSPLSPVSPLPTEVHITGLPSTIQISWQYIAICHSMPQLGRLNLNLCCSSHVSTILISFSS